MQLILCPVDLSECSRSALEQAVAIARGSRAQLTVLHTWRMPSPFDLVGRPYETPADTTEPPGLRLTVQEFVRSVAGDMVVSIRLMHGVDPRRAILTEVDAAAPDLLVIGSHGRSGVDRLLMGSTCSAIVRKVQCPVLVVPPDAVPPKDGRFRRILCGIDFSAPSVQAFRFAIRLAAGDAEIRLLHAIEMPPELRERQLAAAFDVDAVRAGAESAARQRLEALFPGDDVPGVRIVAEVVEGRAHRHIVEAARQQHADVIVLGTHGRNAVDRLMFGSTTDAVLHAAPCPVLTVRPEQPGIL